MGFYIVDLLFQIRRVTAPQALCPTLLYEAHPASLHEGHIAGKDNQALTSRSVYTGQGTTEFLSMYTALTINAGVCDPSGNNDTSTMTPWNIAPSLERKPEATANLLCIVEESTLLAPSHRQWTWPLLPQHTTTSVTTGHHRPRSQYDDGVTSVVTSVAHRRHSIRHLHMQLQLQREELRR